MNMKGDSTEYPECDYMMQPRPGVFDMCGALTTCEVNRHRDWRRCIRCPSKGASGFVLSGLVLTAALCGPLVWTIGAQQHLGAEPGVVRHFESPPRHPQRAVATKSQGKTAALAAGRASRKAVARVVALTRQVVARW